MHEARGYPVCDMKKQVEWEYMSIGEVCHHFLHELEIYMKDMKMKPDKNYVNTELQNI